MWCIFISFNVDADQVRQRPHPAMVSISYLICDGLYDQFCFVHVLYIVYHHLDYLGDQEGSYYIFSVLYSFIFCCMIVCDAFIHVVFVFDSFRW